MREGEYGAVLGDLMAAPRVARPLIVLESFA